MKEPSYQSVAGKGGGLVCIYTAFLSPFHRRVVVVCSRKSTVGEAISIALAKCGKHDHDPKKYDLIHTGRIQQSVLKKVLIGGLLYVVFSPPFLNLLLV